MRRTLVTAAALAASLACASMALGGTISGQVFRDYNSNGAKNAGGFVSGSSVTATDTSMAGVGVRAFNNAGTQVGEATTAADGTYSMSVNATGTVRVEFATPSGYQPSFEGSQAGTSVHFVSAAGATNVNYAVNVPADYCQDNPKLVTCMAPAANVMTLAPTRSGALTVPAAFGAAQSFDERGIEDGQASETALLRTGVSTLSGVSNLGSVFGVGVDRAGFAYFGTYVKRHSPYGPAGAVNAIYRVNVATGATSTFVTLGNEALPAHSADAPTGYPPYSQDGRRSITDPNDPAYSDVYSKVGRTGLGDVDVTPDGSTLLAIEMTQAAPKLWFVPIADPSARTALAIPTTLAAFESVNCIGTFHPMGIGVRGDRILVGGVCGGDETRWVDPVSERTEAAAFVLEVNAARTGFTAITATGMGFDKGGAYIGEFLRPWNYGGPGNAVTGLWRNWSDAAPAWSPNRPAFPAWAAPMLANIEIMDNGDLVLAFRDRFVDQNKVNAVSYEWNGSGGVENAPNYIGAGHLLRMCTRAGGGYVRETNGACNGVVGAGLMGGAPTLLSASGDPANSPGYYATSWYQSNYNGFGAPGDCTTGNKCQLHPYTALGGLTTMPGSPVLWSNVYDVNSYYQQGVRALGPCPDRTASVGACGPDNAADGAMLGGAVVEDSFDPNPYGSGMNFASFRKGNGLGDLELLCDAAPVQIGNRVWIDANKNGIQDADETPVKGVTVRLYNAAGTVVGTALTDAKGQYYFSSNVSKPATGDGGNTGGGLVAGDTFTVKFDRAADYAAGGPLDGYTLTKADATATAGANSTSVNSKATSVGGFPTIAIPARKAGFNNHTYDVGFHLSSDAPVAMGDYTWLDTNKDGKQGKAEKPLKGVKVTLLTASGTQRAKNRAGKLAPIATTDKKGKYLISNLAPGEYRARFEIPAKYCFTKPGARGSRVNSNPVPTKLNRRIGLTPKFMIYGEVKGDTTKFSRKGVTADFANLTIDAGVATCGAQRVIVTG